MNSYRWNKVPCIPVYTTTRERNGDPSFPLGYHADKTKVAALIGLEGGGRISVGALTHSVKALDICLTIRTK